MKVNRLSPYLRLSACLLLSAGLHGSLVFYGWLTSAAESRPLHAPVMVALLPAKTALPAAALPPLAEPQPPRPAPSRPEKTPPRAGTKSRAAVVAAAAAQALPEQPARPFVAEAPQPAPLAAEAVCVTPQVVAAEPSPQPGSLPTAMPADDTPGSGRAAPAASRDLTEATPNYRSNPPPTYPAMARQKRWQGVVWLLVDVSAAGLVDELRVEQGSGHAVLDRAASRSVRRWRFTPAMQRGVPVPSQVRIPVRFRLEDG